MRCSEVWCGVVCVAVKVSRQDGGVRCEVDWVRRCNDDLELPAQFECSHETTCSVISTECRSMLRVCKG